MWPSGLIVQIRSMPSHPELQKLQMLKDELVCSIVFLPFRTNAPTDIHRASCRLPMKSASSSFGMHANGSCS